MTKGKTIVKKRRSLIKYREENHQLADELRAQVLAGNLPGYAEMETWKTKYQTVLQQWENGETTLDELIKAVEARLKAWYFRSAVRLPQLHPSYPVFTAMLMNEEHIVKLFPAEAVAWLIEQYGKRKGTISGSYWTLNNLAL